ncbi:putative drug antiporter protein precursor [Catellatospora sp. TT07R-123]|uniref:MFS transporter n=1 Tax=Catellatospora sp. TT07R-123 TaxID=2733863 RepID=UPI001B1A398C|nr:MFS transporter [Catellatospora sp. TT07R-123]GHJ47259.1 putative drug antiporter protein precursor [Catellatospora sp. TT07R-123]
MDTGRLRADLVRLVAAEAVSNIGTRMTFFAVPWLVLVTTGDPVKVGLVAGAETLTYVVSGVLAAPLQDRIGARRTSLWSDAGSVVAMAGVAVAGRYGFGLLLALVAILGVLRAQGDRAKVTLIVPLMGGAGGDYARVAATREGVLRTSTLAGSSLAGIAVVVFGPIGGIWIDAATYAVAVALTIATRPPAPESAATAPVTPYFTALREGFGWFRRNRLLRAVTGMLFFTNLFNQASAVVFVPLWVYANMDDPAALGAVATAYAVGLIAGNALVAWLAPILPRYPTLVAGYFIGGAPRFVVLALTDDLLLIVVVTLIGGIAMSSLNPTVSAMIYQRTPKEMLSRMGGIITAVAFGGAPLGGLLAGYLVQYLGLTNAILVATAMYFTVTLTPVIGHRLWRELNDTAPPRPRPGDGRPLPLLYGLAGAATGPRVSLRYADGLWTLQARRGLRSLARRQRVVPKTAVGALSRLDVPALRTALHETIQHDRALAERQTRQVRGQVAHLDRVLADVTRALDRG